MAPTRRDLLRGGIGALGALGVAGVAGCTHATEPDPGPDSDPDVALLRAALADERRLLTQYDAAMRAYPALRARLRPVRDDHAAHRRAWERQLPETQRPREPAPPAAGAAGTKPPAPGEADAGAAADSAGTVRSLLAAEAAAADDRAAAALTSSTRLAPLFASVAAGEDTHAALLSVRPSAATP